MQPARMRAIEPAGWGRQEGPRQPGGATSTLRRKSSKLLPESHASRPIR
jgi:hypothetical protein